MLDELVPTIPTIEDLSVNCLSGMSTVRGNRFYDNSTLDTFRVCPRRFYYRHIRHWETEGTRAPLIFGSAWHASMDAIWQAPSTITTEQAFAEFMKVWNASDLVEQEEFDLFPRTPQKAKTMISMYLDRYRSWLTHNIELIAVELPFIVPLTFDKQNLFYVGKWDKLFKEGRFYHICDHKTSSSFANTWLNSWSPNGQVDGYLYAGHMSYGDDFKSVLIDGALVQKTKEDFIRVPVERQIDMLDAWKWEVLDLIELIFYYETMLMEIRESGRTEKFLAAYPKCTTSCTSYYGSCPYINLCKFIPNPEHCVEPPDSFCLSNWKPFEVDESPTGEFIVKLIEHT